MKTISRLVFLFTVFLSVCTQAQDTSLVAYFPFNGNALDVTGNGHNGTVNGGVLTNDRFNQQEKAYTFPNLHNNIVLDNSTSMNFENGFTLNTWVKYKNINCGIVGKHNCWVVNGFYLGIDNGHFWLRLANSVWSDIVTSEVYVEDQWYMVTGVYDHTTSTGKVYVNGVLKASGSVLYNNYSSAPITISEASNGCPDGNMPGAIDEVKIFNRALSDAEILAEYNSTYSDLVLFLPFNGNADDESGSGNNGTVNGASLTQDRFGVNSSAYNFDGIDDFISIVDNPNLFSDSLTISWWYNISEYDDAGAVIGWIEGGARYQQFFNGTSFSYFNAYRSDPFSFINPIYNLTNLNEWTNVLVTYKKISQTSSTTSLFINGELKQTDTHFMSMEYLPGHTFYIGRNHTPGIEFKGKLDDFRIYNRILNNDEIFAIYNDSTTYNPQLISSVYPLQNSNNCLRNESIQVSFTEPMNDATFTYNSVSIFGNLTGSYELSFNYQSSTNTIEITPTVPFKYGEQITVTLDSTIQSVSGYNLSQFTFQFNVKPEKGSFKFAVADSFQLNFTPTNIVSGDFNNDNKIDVIVSNYDSSKYTVLINNGSGGFNLGEELAGPFKPYSISFTDIDNDRDLDMIVSTNEENKIRVLRGTGQGIFSWILPYIDVSAPIATCPGDFDGDGDNDFVALCNTGHAVFYGNDGTGVFTPSGSTVINVPAGLRNIVGDIDNDGDLDIIGGTGDYSGVFKILENDGNGNFTFTGGPYLGPYPDELAGGDFDGDYDLDFIKCDWYQSGLGIGLNNGSGEFPVQNFLNLGNVGGIPRNPVANDFDGDGDIDAANTNGNNFQTLKNNGSLNFVLDNYSLGILNGLSAADFDNNGSIDLVGISNTTNQIKFLRNISDSLIAYFPFNGNANDESVFANNGTVVGATLTYDRYGNTDNAYNFNGVNDRIYVPENSIYDFGVGDFTISSWVNISNISTARIVSAGFDANDNIWGLGFGTNPVWGTGKRINYFVYSNNNYRDFSSNEITDYSTGVWNFITATKINDQIRFYQNGLPVGETTINYPSNSNSYMSIGCRQVTSNNFIEFLNGKIDEVKIFNTSFSDEQIKAMYLSTTTAPTLIFPVNNGEINTLQPTFDWDSTVTATYYNIFISTDSTFATLILDQNSSSSSYQIASGVLQPNTQYFWKVRTINDGGIGPWSEIYTFRTLLTDVEDETKLPKEFALMQNYPNPFNPSTTITYHLPKTARVELKIYDVLGNEITTLVNEEKPAGIFNVQFTMNNIQLSSGIYFCKLKAGEYLETKKMILIK